MLYQIIIFLCNWKYTTYLILTLSIAILFSILVCFLKWRVLRSFGQCIKTGKNKYCNHCIFDSLSEWYLTMNSHWIWLECNKGFSGSKATVQTYTHLNKGQLNILGQGTGISQWFERKHFTEYVCGCVLSLKPFWTIRATRDCKKYIEATCKRSDGFMRTSWTLIRARGERKRCLLVFEPDYNAILCAWKYLLSNMFKNLN